MANPQTDKAVADAPPVTEILARFAAEHPSGGWTAEVDAEAHRTFANWVGCTIGPSAHPTVQAALAAVQELQPAPQASLLGRREKVDMASAALINGISSHTWDFDDTHLKSVVHPAGPVAPAALALCEHLGLSGRQLLDALVIGIEVSCRVGNAIYPDHFDRGWHITGTTGMLGSAAACSRLLGLDPLRTQMALGLAASQPIGLREQFGTMTKPFHPGGAARVGLMSALMARHGFTASPRALEAPRGLLQVFSDKADWHEISDGLGTRWESALNTYKPFACGVVNHPAIDGCIQLRDAHGLNAGQVQKVLLKVHPLVLELAGKKTPANGLQAKFSIYHSCAVGLIFGRAGENEYGDDVVTRPDVLALRAKVEAITDPRIGAASAELTLHTTDGRELHLTVEHAVGSVHKPMSDAQLHTKFAGQSEPVIGAARAAQAWELSMSIAKQPDLRGLIATVT